MAVEYNIQQATPQIVTARKRVDSNKIIELGFEGHDDKISNIRAEEALIGAVLLNPEQAYPQVSEMVQPSDFFYLQHGFIWHAIQQIERQGDQINLITILKHLRQHKTAEVDEGKLGTLTSAAPDINHAESFARIVRDFARIRRVLMATDEIRNLLLSPGAITDVDILMDQCMDQMYIASEQLLKHEEVTLKATADNILDDLEQRMDTNVKPGFSIGHIRLNDKLGNLQPKELCIVGGTSGQGKTTWMLSTILKAVQRGEGVALFSLEMTKREITQTLISMLTGISKTTIKSGVLSTVEHGKAIEALAAITQYPLYIIDKTEYPELTPSQMRRRLKILMRRYNIAAAYVDGIWLMEPDPEVNLRGKVIDRQSENRARDIHRITIGLIKNADTFNIPIVAMHQYTRDYAKRMSASKKLLPPTTYDFAEGSACERNAQILIALHRPALFITTDDDGDRTIDQTLAYVLKDRNGGYVDKQPIAYNYDPRFATYQETPGYAYPF